MKLHFTVFLFAFLLYLINYFVSFLLFNFYGLTIFNHTKFPQLNLIHSFVDAGMLFHL